MSLPSRVYSRIWKLKYAPDVSNNCQLTFLDSTQECRQVVNPIAHLATLLGLNKGIKSVVMKSERVQGSMVKNVETVIRSHLLNGDCDLKNMELLQLNMKRNLKLKTTNVQFVKLIRQKVKEGGTLIIATRRISFVDYFAIIAMSVWECSKMTLIYSNSLSNTSTTIGKVQFND